MSVMAWEFCGWIILNMYKISLRAASSLKLAFRSWKLGNVSRLVTTGGVLGWMDGPSMEN